MRLRPQSLLLLLPSLTEAALTYCSSENTGSSYASTSSQYQSNGLCTDSCAGYAYAVILGTECWCSNYTPSDTTSTSDCSDDCPGYPSEKCGNTDEELYAYILIGTPSSSSSTKTTSSSTTQPGSSTGDTQTSSTTSPSTTSTTSTTAASSSSTTSSTSSTTSSTTSSKTSSSSSVLSSSLSSSGDSSSSSTSTSSPSSSSTSSSSVQAITSVIYSVMTITDSAQTQVTTTQVVSTIISLPSTTSSDSTSSETSSGSNSDFFDSKGKVAGVFTAVGVVAIAIVSALLYFFCFKKRSAEDDNNTDAESTASAINYDNEKFSAIPPPGTVEAVGQGGLNGVAEDDFDFVQVDQRLDPGQMFTQWENGSRNSLADELDYSRRVLRVTNAD